MSDLRDTAKDLWYGSDSSGINQLFDKQRRLELFRIVRIDNPAYIGVAGDRAILQRVCVCGKAKAFEYGSYKAMFELYASPTSTQQGEEG
jgi:hypothetical protein